MKCLLIQLFCFMSVAAWSQNDSTVYEQGIPVSDDDTVQNFPRQDFYPKKKIEVLSYNAVPDKIKKALNKNSLYKGWNRLPIYHDLNTDIFYVRIVNKTDTTTYGLNKHGDPVTYGEHSVNDERR
jgi:hypothetical protein